MQAYAWKSASYIRANANQAGQMCEQLAATKGLTPKNLVDANRPEDAPLHDEFEWRDDIAAEKYRESQARHIILSLVLVPEQKEIQPVRAFFSVTGSGYESTELILRTPDKKEALLQQATRELQAFRRKYAALIQMAEVIEAIDTLLAKETV